MNSEIISRAACLAELTSNPKSFFNCPDLHGGSGFAGKIPLLDPADNYAKRIHNNGTENGVTSKLSAKAETRKFETLTSEWSEGDERHGRHSREVAVERCGSSRDTKAKLLVDV